MSHNDWSVLTQPPGLELSVWELFHENSKSGVAAPFVSEISAAQQSARMAQPLDFVSCPVVKLPEAVPCAVPLSVALTEAAGAPEVAKPAAGGPGIMSVLTLASILRHAYGMRPPTGDSLASHRPAAALTPVSTLELFVHCSKVQDVPAGLYHYSAAAGELRLLRRADQSHTIAGHLRQQRLAYDASAIVFIAAVPERAVLVYGERGYRYVLMEAGAVLQNVVLISRALDVTCIPSGDYVDCRVDGMLDFDGITMSVVCLVALLTRA